MKKITQDIFKDLYRPAKQSHKGQNGKLTIIGGSKLFHGASLWALKTASRIVDMVFYSTVKDNEELTKGLKSKLYDFICVPRHKVEDYVSQSDAVLIGPGMVSGGKQHIGTGESGQQTRDLVKNLLFKFADKKWIIDAGALQEIETSWLKKLNQVIITPHLKEFERLFGSIKDPVLVKDRVFMVKQKSREYNCIIVLKGPTDLVCSPEKCVVNTTGNQGMTKGGTGDVLAGLIAALACKNELFLASKAGIYINGLTGDELFRKVGPFFNASDLCDAIPRTMKKLLGY